MAAASSQLLVKITGDVSGLKGALRGAKSEVAGFAKSAEKSFKNAGSAMTGMGKKMSMGVTLPLVALGVVAMKTAGDFEQQMNIMAVSAGDAGESMEDLRSAAIAVGADTKLVGISASEAADSITELYKAGLETNEIFGDMQGYLAGTAELGGVLRASIDMAAASELDLASATELVNVTLSQFGMSAEDATMLVNSFVQAADASVASVGELADAYKNAGTTMAAFGFSIEEVNTVLAMLSNKGIKGAEAGTALKSMFTNMMRDTKKVKGALNELNLSFYDAEGKMKSMEDILGGLNKALGENAQVTLQAGGASKQQAKDLTSYATKIRNAKIAIEEYSAGVRGASYSEAKRAEKIAELTRKIGFYEGKQKDLMNTIPGVTQAMMDMTEEQRNQYIQTLAGTYGMKAMNALLAEGEDGYSTMAEAIAAGATAAEVAEARTRGYAGVMEQLGGAWETFMIAIGTPLIDTLTPWIAKLADFIGKLSQSNPALLSLITKVLLVAALIGPVLIIFGSLASAIGSIIGVAGALGGIFGGLAGIIGGALAAIGGAIAAIGWPILIIVAALAALYLAWKTNFLGIQDAMAPFVKALKSTWGIVVGFFDNVKQLLKGEIGWDEFVERAKSSMTGLKVVWKNAWESMKMSLARFWEGIKAAAASAWDSIKALVLQKLAEFIAPIIGSVDEAKAVIIQAWENVKTGLIAAWEGIKTAAVAIWGGIKEVLAITVEYWRGILAAFMR